MKKKRNRIYEQLGLSIDTNDPEIEKLSENQLDFILHDISHSCYLEACPGAGKTEVIGLKSSIVFPKILLLSLTEQRFL